MAVQWLNSNSEKGRFGGSAGASSSLAGVSSFLTRVSQTLAKPTNLARIRQVVIVLLALWAVSALARLVWALVPAAAEPPPSPSSVVNPVLHRQVSSQGSVVDVNRMVGWHLFGEVGAAPVEAVAVVETVPSVRDGIEQGAAETRLKLTLRGIVASTDDGLGHAIIEHKSRQAVYAVEDQLPVSGKVVLAKVMPKQVVLNNRGTYELLKLFDDTPLGKKAPNSAAKNTPRRAVQRPVTAGRDIDKRSDETTTEMARGFRDTLYKDPQSLAKLVRVGAVRENGELRGYRVSPGQQSAQFKQLGFESGDLVTAVNGIRLDNPANTMQLYNAMRSAGEVVFEVERNSQPVTISVNLSDSLQ